MMALVTYAAVPAFAGAGVLCVVTVEAIDAAASPYVSLGVAGVLLGVIVVPTFRWLMARVDRQQEQQEKLIAALQASVEQHAIGQGENRRIHEQLLAAAQTTNILLQSMQREAKQ